MAAKTAKESVGVGGESVEELEGRTDGEGGCDEGVDGWVVGEELGDVIPGCGEEDYVEYSDTASEDEGLSSVSICGFGLERGPGWTYYFGACFRSVSEGCTDEICYSGRCCD